jgi:SAM-dependent methyltransferase
MSAYISLAPYYDELTEDVPYSSFADFYEVIFKKYELRPQMILDLACGTGTLTYELARRGYEMIGVDLSEDMLSEAAKKAASESFRVAPMFLCQSMEELDLYGTVSAAVCSLDGIDYVPPESLSEVFHRLHLFVEPGGIIVFDVNTPEKLRSLDGEVFLDETEDVYCVWRAEFDEELGACVYGMDIFAHQGGDMWLRGEEEHIEYAHSAKLLCDKLTEQGFGDILIFGELEDRPPEPDEQRIFIAARRL